MNKKNIGKGGDRHGRMAYDFATQHNTTQHNGITAPFFSDKNTHIRDG